ncbi:hypothetical protein KPL71_022377 [Citrus sinensis]|uniref:Uncharacterized protein n=1 Tax=Citrus sinensis TaxID=2711 RepID=A0ACB8IBC7_CITSI|nr:hypothetical protein KPL71_022377 [Citrus sinensis]
MMSRSVAKSASWSDVKVKPWHNTQKQQVTATRSMLVIEMRDRGQNRKPLQRGRNLSIEAIQAVQHLKRAHLHSNPLDHVFNSKFRRLLKFDMIAVLRELLRQNHCLLALKVFEDIRKEQWYKPQVSLYADMIQVFGTNGLFQHVEILYFYLKTENSLEPEIQGFNALLKCLVGFKLRDLVVDCYELMKTVGCEPDRSSYRTVINGLEAMEEVAFSGIIRQDAFKYYGDLEFLEEDEEDIAAYC